LNPELYDEVVGAIYDAVTDPLRLKHACAATVKAVHATGAHLVGVDKKTGEVVTSAISGFSPLGEVDYVERYAKVDPRAPVFLAAPVAHWHSCHERFDQAFVDNNEFFQDFLIPYGSRYMSAVKLIDTESYTAVLGVHHALDRGPIGAGALAFLKRLTPHFQRAMRLIYEHSRLHDQWSIIKATLDSLDYATAVCDTSGELLVGNEAALGILHQGDGIRLKVGRIELNEPALQRRLRALLLECTAADPLADAPVRGALMVARPSGLQPYQVVLRAIRPERTMFVHRGEPLWSIVINDPARASAPTIRAIAMLYGLTPAEAHLAESLIAGGNPDEIAQQRGVRITTIRSQLASLFSKTGARRQAELVRIFSTVPALR
jgi:DNA-binding CsgD family transcriptional regulator